MMAAPLEIGNIGIGTTGNWQHWDWQHWKLATLNNDRFLIVDDKELYLIGASLKDLGHKCFGFTKMDKGEIRRIKKEAFGAGLR